MKRVMTRKKGKLNQVLAELKKNKKTNLTIQWVNRKQELKERIVRIAGLAYDGRGRVIVVVRDVHNTKMLFNLPLEKIVSMTPVSRAKLKVS